MSASLPKTHTAIQLTNPGPTPTVSLTPNLPLPTLSPGQVLVKNTYSGINYIENYFLSGLYPAPSYPYTLGREGEGYIASISPDLSSHPDPSVKELKVGDRVAYLSGSAYAEFTAAPVEKVFKLPSSDGPGGLKAGLGAAAFLQGLTALTLAQESYPAKKGEIVLVHAAAGGVGLLLTQYLSRVIGARVIATASTPEKLELAKASGAEWTVLYGSPTGSEWISEIQSIPDVISNGGVSAIYDSVGKVTFDGGLEVIAVKGTFVSFGNASGAVEPLLLTRLSKKNIKVLRPQLFPYIDKREEFVRYSEELVKLVGQGVLDVKVHKTYPWGEVETALKDIRSRGTTGKLLLKIE